MPASAYLPKTFDPSRPLVLIAGQGVYPRLVAESARRAGIALRLLGLPTLISGGVPVAMGAGCLTLAAWSSDVLFGLVGGYLLLRTPT